MTEHNPDYYIHPTAIIDTPCSIGKGTKIWHFVHVCADATIGEQCVLGQNVFVASGVTIGNNVHIQNNVSVYMGVTLEDNVFCGPSMVFTNDLTPRVEYPKGNAGYLPTVVKHGASIGANATIVCGVTIGEYALIGAGCVVTEDIPPYALVYGVPARRQGRVDERGNVVQRFDKDFLFSTMAGWLRKVDVPPAQ